MPSGFKVLLISTLLVSSFAQANMNRHADPVGDMDVKPFACPDLQTDLIGTNFQRVGNNVIVTMETQKDIKKNFGYKEFYFWLDLTHDTRRGYQPYNPESVAWPDLYANYRIFYSIDANNIFEDRIPNEKVALQNCLKSDCTGDQGLNYNSKIKVRVQKNTVTFQFPASLLPEMATAETIRVGYTSYFEYMQCNGEDDSPQWGERAHEVYPEPPPPPMPN